MGYRQVGKLADLGREDAFLAMTRRTVERVGEVLHERTVAHTPVAKPPPGVAAEWLAARKRAPGTLKRSWQLGSVVVGVGGLRFSIDVYTFDPVAPHVEYPTMPHLIYPRGFSSNVVTHEREQPMLRWWDGAGRIHFGWVVHHPGTQGSFMLTRALADISQLWLEIGRDEMAKWAREQERGF